MTPSTPEQRRDLGGFGVMLRELARPYLGAVDQTRTGKHILALDLHDLWAYCERNPEKLRTANAS